MVALLPFPEGGGAQIENLLQGADLDGRVGARQRFDPFKVEGPPAPRLPRGGAPRDPPDAPSARRGRWRRRAPLPGRRAPPRGSALPPAACHLPLPTDARSRRATRSRPLPRPPAADRSPPRPEPAAPEDGG